MANYEEDSQRREEEYGKAQVRSNGYNKDQVTWKYVLSIASAVLLICLGAMGWLLSKGYDNLMEGNKRIENNQERSIVAFQKRCDEGELRDKYLSDEQRKIDKRLSGVEIWITMPYDQRIKALEKLGGVVRQ